MKKHEYIQERNSDEFNTKLNRLLKKGGKVVTIGTTLENAQYTYESGNATTLIANVYWAIVESEEGIAFDSRDVAGRGLQTLRPEDQ